MQASIEAYYAKRLAEVAEALRGNHFDAHVVADVAAAKALVLDRIIPDAAPRTVSFGGSMTLVATGLPEALKTLPGVSVLDTMEKLPTPEEAYERRRQALLVDLFLSGPTPSPRTACWSIWT